MWQSSTDPRTGELLHILHPEVSSTACQQEQGKGWRTLQICSWGSDAAVLLRSSANAQWSPQSFMPGGFDLWWDACPPLPPHITAIHKRKRYLPSIHVISQPAAMPNETPLQRCDDTCLPTTALNGFQVDPRSFPAKRWPKKHGAVFSLCYSPLFHPTWQYLTVLRARNKPTILRKRTSACTFQNNAFSKRTL